VPTSGRFAILLLAAMLLVGCGGTLHPPAWVEQPTTIYVKIDYRHSSLLLPRHTVGLVEYTYGDWRYFALADTGLWVGLVALLGSPQATLGRRDPASHAEAEQPGVRILPVVVDRRRADALAMTLEARFRRRVATLHYNDRYNLWFVKDPERYHLLNNCNHVTARWLRQLGCRVDGLTITNDFRLSGGVQD
jgi:hypothetical protein